MLLSTRPVGFARDELETGGQAEAKSVEKGVSLPV
jgi:hypothetical protein